MKFVDPLHDVWSNAADHRLFSLEEWLAQHGDATSIDDGARQVLGVALTNDQDVEVFFGSCLHGARIQDSAFRERGNLVPGLCPGTQRPEALPPVPSMVIVHATLVISCSNHSA